MNGINIKMVAPDEVDILTKISRKTFSETFSSMNTPEDMAQYLNEQFSTDKLTKELKNKNSEFYFVRQGSRVIGYLKVNFGRAQTELKEEKSVEIERIYVLREFQGKHAGQLLYQQAIQIAKQKNADYIWLGVWEKNERAIDFYKKNGFVEFDKHIFKLGNDKQTDIMMKQQLN